MASTFQDFLDQYKGTVTAENKAKIAAAQKAAAAAAKLVKFNSSDPVKKEQEQAAFLVAAEAASNLLATSRRYRTGAASNAEAKKAFDAYTKSIAALRKLTPCYLNKTPYSKLNLFQYEMLAITAQYKEHNLY